MKNRQYLLIGIGVALVVIIAILFGRGDDVDNGDDADNGDDYTATLFGRGDDADNGDDYTATTTTTTARTGSNGSEDQLKILYWQAPSIMNPYLSGGTKDQEAASLVIEPLARYDQDANLVPYLAEEIPTVANGAVAEDLRSIVWTLREGLVWSDGTKVTAEDAVFTAKYCMHADSGCAQLSNFADIESVEALDDRTIRISFTIAKTFPYAPLVGAEAPLLQKAQFENCLGARAPECTEQNFYPIGTGPFRVTKFQANDYILYEANPNYRTPGKPHFKNVLVKGGGDAASAARSVLETGGVRLCLEHPGGAGNSRADGRSRQGRGPQRFRHPGGTYHGELHRSGFQSRRPALNRRRRPASVPDQPRRHPRHVAGH